MLKKYIFGILLLAAVGMVAALALLMSFRGQLSYEVDPIVLDRTTSPSSSASASAGPSPSATSESPSPEPTTEQAADQATPAEEAPAVVEQAPAEAPVVEQAPAVVEAPTPVVVEQVPAPVVVEPAPAPRRRGAGARACPGTGGR
ncbi:hypothetical protein [Rothia nasimurium]|uniref:hypothetical protein n=1 Tax=Rothia nasimurium TaxID=85336 RepID=UPI002DD6B64E|nr:hypothetical protein [Rothia nasimurium]